MRCRRGSAPYSLKAIRRLRQTSLFPVDHFTVGIHFSGKKLRIRHTNTRYDGNAFVQKYLLHLLCHSPIQVVNFISRSWYLVVFIMSVQGRVRRASQCIYSLYLALSPVPIRSWVHRPCIEDIGQTRTYHKIYLRRPVFIQIVQREIRESER